MHIQRVTHTQIRKIESSSIHLRLHSYKCNLYMVRGMQTVQRRFDVHQSGNQPRHFLSTHSSQFVALCDRELLDSCVCIENLIRQSYHTGSRCHRHKFLQEIAGQIECGALHVSGNFHILANDLRQSCLTDFIQLSFSEFETWIIGFVPTSESSISYLIWRT